MFLVSVVSGRQRLSQSKAEKPLKPVQKRASKIRYKIAVGRKFNEWRNSEQGRASKKMYVDFLNLQNKTEGGSKLNGNFRGSNKRNAELEGQCG